MVHNVVFPVEFLCSESVFRRCVSAARSPTDRAPFHFLGGAARRVPAGVGRQRYADL